MKPKLAKFMQAMGNKSDSGIGPSPMVAKEFVSKAPMMKKKMLVKKAK